MRCLVLVWPLLLGFLYTGQSCTEDMLKKDGERCCKECPRGYYIAGRCGDMHRCEECATGRSFTDQANMDKCLPCTICSVVGGQKTLKACSHKNDAVCACGEGYVPVGDTQHDLSCQWSCKGYTDPCQHRKCSKNCPSTTTTTTTMTTTTMTSPLTTLKTSTSNPIMSPLVPASTLDPQVLIPSIAVVLVAILLLVSFSFVIRRQLYCSPEKALEFPIENPKINEQQQQSSTQDTQTLKIWDGPSMIICPEDPLTSALLPDPQRRAPTQDRQADCWPAAVLYAIIKVVPLRRWKEFLRLLSVADRQLERVELEVSHCLGSLEKQYQMLTLWSHSPSAALDDVYSALHYMDLAGCAQQLQESLENLHWETNNRLKLVDVRQNRAALQ